MKRKWRAVCQDTKTRLKVGKYRKYIKIKARWTRSGSNIRNCFRPRPDCAAPAGYWHQIDPQNQFAAGIRPQEAAK